MAGSKISINQGELIGNCVTNENGFKYNTYCGIPYAKPPIGHLRFKDPQPHEGWSGVLDATKEGNPSFHYEQYIFKKILGSEDCLFLNVYTPADVTEDSKLPVMFWIHGGGYYTGSGSKLFYDPENLVSKNIIVVTCNYRLGFFGFLCLHTLDAPGNQGLKDQVMALKWVQNNIHKFGGDINNVTVFGESAGGASVNFLLLSPLAKGLYHKVIMQSGCVLNPWAMQTNPIQSAFMLGEKLGFKGECKNELLNFFNQIPPEDIYTLVDKEFNLFNKYNFISVIENQIENPDAYITLNPLESLMTGKFIKVPVIIGANSREGLIILTKYVLNNKNIKDISSLDEIGLYLDEELNTFLPFDSDKKSTIKDFYFKQNKSSIENYIDLIGDIIFIIGIRQLTKLFSKFALPTYSYIFSYNGCFNIFKYILNCKYDEGACHADEIAYLFKPNIKNIQDIRKQNFTINEIDVKVNDCDILTANRMAEMWTNFAKFSNPTPETSSIIPIIWKSVNENELNCLDINEDINIINDPLSERLKIWDQFLQK